MNESGVAVMKLCVRMLRVTYRKEVRNGNKVGGCMH